MLSVCSKLECYFVVVTFCLLTYCSGEIPASRQCFPASDGNPAWFCKQLDHCPEALNLIQIWKEPLPVKQKCGYKGPVLLICCPPYPIDSWVNPIRSPTKTTITISKVTTTSAMVTTATISGTGNNLLPPSTSQTSPGPPKPDNTDSGGREYLGCYEDQVENRLLVEIKERSDKLTVTTCIEYCSGKGYPFAGSQNGSECFCGNSRPPQVAKRPESECSTPCSGDLTERCGGLGRISVYKTSTTGAVGALPNGFYLGCFKELNEGNTTAKQKIFPGFRKDLDSMTPKKCFETCFMEGYKLSGIQNGVECHCSNTKLDILSRKTNDADCKIPCDGDSAKNCGGDSRLSVYATGLTDLPVSGRQIGCYIDAPGENGRFERVLPDFKIDLPEMNSPRTCLNICYQLGYIVAGVQYGFECFCGTQLPLQSKTRPDKQCSMVCPGDPNETCGGHLRLQTFRTPLTDKPAPTEYLGCYQDQVENRLLGEVREWKSKLTIAMCIDLCAERGYPFAGPQYGSECFCGYNRPPQMAKQSDSECSQPCGGNRKEKCGGLGKISVYKTGIPAVGALPNGFHLGCFKELEKGNTTAEKNLLPGIRKDFDNMTPKVCFEMCFKKGYKLSGVANGKECYCSNTVLDMSRKTYDSDCKIPCAGDSALTCGDNGRLSVYATGLTDIPETGRLIGCYEDIIGEGGKYNRVLGDYKINMPEINTPQLCLNMCYQMGFNYAGLEYGMECFCGMQRPPQSKIKPDDQCAKECPGDETKMCGGGWRMQIYRTPLAG